jgi:hypothetical protein
MRIGSNFDFDELSQSTIQSTYIEYISQKLGVEVNYLVQENSWKCMVLSGIETWT